MDTSLGFSVVVVIAGLMGVVGDKLDPVLQFVFSGKSHIWRSSL